jgi:hypothetical protein
MKNNPLLLEFWKLYIPHIKNPKDAIFYLYYKEIFNELYEFFHFSCKHCVLMGDFILASQFLEKAGEIM